MDNKLFRKKSLDKISSPEQLNDYIRVANPNVWMILVAIMILLLGVCVWGVFGKLDTVVTTGAVTENGCTICYVKESSISSIEIGMPVIINNEEYSITEIAAQPVQTDESFSDYLLHTGSFSDGEWVYGLTLDSACGQDGAVYKAEIITESVAPMSFVIN